MSVETGPSCEILDEPAERLGNFHKGARALACCLQKHDVSRKTDQSVIEATRCMFHKLLGEVRDDLDRVTPRSLGGLCTVILKQNPCPRPARNLHFRRQQKHRLPGSSAEILEQVIEDDPSQRARVVGTSIWTWRVETRIQMSSCTTNTLNLLFTAVENKSKTRKFRMYIGPGSDGSSADKLSIDLKFNPWDTAVTFRPEWRSLSKTGLHATRPIQTLVYMSERLVTWRCQNVLSSTNAECDRCSSVSVCSGGHSSVDRFCFLPVCKKQHWRFTFLSRLTQGEACDVEQETEERNCPTA